VERFWGTLWRECLEAAIFIDLADAQTRIALFIDHYNFQRLHQGIGGLVPADRYFHAAPEVLQTLKERVEANAAHIARHGMPKKPFYLTGHVDGKPFSVHAEGERVILTKENGSREEVDLVRPEEERKEDEMPRPLCPMPEGNPAMPGAGNEEPPAPGTSPLDALEDVAKDATNTEDKEDDDGQLVTE
jgi:hypothetical protein